MAVKSIDCPNCGHGLTVSGNQDIVECRYCKSSVAVREQIKIKQTVDVEPLFCLGSAAFEACNYQEAYDYAIKILEYDAKDADAWRLKGMAGAHLATLANNRITEVIQAFENALIHAPNGYLDKVIQMADFMNTFAMESFQALKVNINEISRDNDGLAMALVNLLDITKALTLAIKFKPDDDSILKNLIEVYSYLIPLTSKEAQVGLKQVKEEFVSCIRKKEPNYVPPTISSSSCFVVTATMGDANHPNVIVLRNFRDSVLLEYSWGKSFISWYYQHGQSIADFIADKRLFRCLSYFLIVMPASETAKFLLKYLKNGK